VGPAGPTSIHGLPARRCFGLRLLERGLATQADLRFQPEGLRCTLRLSPPTAGGSASAA
jgi:two-component sensor histidine kinase